jgi:hypothetical protein
VVGQTFEAVVSLISHVGLANFLCGPFVPRSFGELSVWLQSHASDVVSRLEGGRQYLEFWTPVCARSCGCRETEENSQIN